MENLRNYFDYYVSLHTGAAQHLRFYLVCFAIITGSVMLCHTITAQQQSLGALLKHTLSMGLIYTLSLALIESLLLFIRRNRSMFTSMAIKHIWLISLVMFLLGYMLISPLNDLHYAELHPHWEPERGIEPLIRSTPVWLLITFMFIQSRLKLTLQEENQTLQKIAQGLERQAKTLASHTEKSNVDSNDTAFPVNKGNLSYHIDVNDIGLVKVEDHYCYLHVLDEDDYKPIDIQSSLQDVMSQLPQDRFIQVHRAYLINLAHITQLKKVPRSYELVIGQNKFVIPVSRHRLSEILPRLSRHLLI